MNRIALITGGSRGLGNGVGATIPIAEVTEDDFDNLVNIHFKGVYFLTQKLLPHHRFANCAG